MINKQNFHYYLKCLVKIADERPLCYDEIHQEFLRFFTLPGICQAINICIPNKPEIDYDKVGNFFKDKTFPDFDILAKAIQDNFESDYEKLYACFYYVANNIEYDYERSCLTEREPLSVHTIFNIKKGVCVEYSKLFRELAKQSGISSYEIPISPFENASKGAGWDSYQPPSEPDYEHEAIYIKIKDQLFLSEPTWAAGSLDQNNQFNFKYNKAHFLIPYYKGIVDHFPKNKLNDSLIDNFTWESFTSINKADIGKELCFESNPFQKVTVENGFYEMQFSLIQTGMPIVGEICILEENSWQKQNNNLISYECLAINLPDNSFSYSKNGRCRYKLTISFPKKGQYRVHTALKNGDSNPVLFTSYFDVKESTDKLIGIPGYYKEIFGFIPIVPREGLTKITNGFVRIRFAVKLSKSNVFIELYEIKKGTFDRENEDPFKFEKKNWNNCYTTNLPFNYKGKDENLEDYLVENWLLVNFPKDGLFEVVLYFAEGEKIYHGASYYFDVTGTINDNIIYPFFDLPNNRTFIPFIIDKKEYIRVDPPEKTIIINNRDFKFHIFSEKKCRVCFEEFYSGERISPELYDDTKKDGTIIDFVYSAPILKEGYYRLLIADDNEEGIVFAEQNYFILPKEFKLPKESINDKKMMKELKNLIEGKIDYLKDVPSDIRIKVEKWVANSIKDHTLNDNNDNKDNKLLVVNNKSSELESEEEKIKLKMKIIDLEQEKDQLKQIATELGKQKEEQEKHASTLEQEKNEISNKLNNLMKQFEDLNSKSTETDKEKSEIFMKFKDLEQRKQELENKANNLEQEKENLSSKFNEFVKQKEEQEKNTILIEQEKDELKKKVAELEKQKEEIILRTAKEKSIAESKVLSCENKIQQLEAEIKKHENHALSLEQEKTEINNELNNSKSNKDDMIGKLKELENQANVLSVEKNSMNNQIKELLQQKKELENYARSLELKNNEISQNFGQLLKQKEEISKKSSEKEKENNEMVTKLRELEQRKQELEVQTNLLIQEKSKYNEFVKQKEEHDKSAKNLEQEKSELLKKVVELEKQKEELIKSTAKEKLNTDSKVLSFENRINELMKEKEEHENHAKNLEQDKKNLSNQVAELEKQIKTIISRERTEILGKNMDDINYKPNPKEIKSDQAEMESKQKEIQSDIELNPKKRKSKRKKRKSIQAEIESDPKEIKSNQAEIELKSKRKQSIQAEIESNPKKGTPRQKEMKSNLSEIKSNQAEIELKSKRKQSNQAEIESNPKKGTPSQKEMESNLSEIKSDQTEMGSNSKGKQSIQAEIESNPKKGTPIQKEMESNQTEDNDKMKQIGENRLEYREENKHITSKTSNEDDKFTSIRDHDTTNEPVIQEPKPKLEGNSPRKKIKQLYETSNIDQIILPRTPPKRVKCKRPIRLTVTLKDIGMENFDQPYDKLPTLFDSKKITNVHDIRNDSKREEGEIELPKLPIHKHKTKIPVQTQNQITQTQPLENKKSPRKIKERFYNYDPSIFYTPICPESPVGPVRYFKDPIKLTVTLKDIGMEKFES